MTKPRRGRPHRRGRSRDRARSAGKRLVSGSSDKTLKVWDAANGHETLTLKGHTSPVSSVVFSPDGKRIVSGGDDKTIKIWDGSLNAPRFASD